MKEQLEAIRTQGLEAVRQAEDLKDLDEARVAYLGRKGKLTEILRGLSGVAPEERPALGKLSNEIKRALTEAVEEREKALKAESAASEAEQQRVDLSLPGRKPPEGHAHLVPKVAAQCVDIFVEMGFQVAEGPDVETEYYNFDSLNTPSDHPSRDLHDSFFVKPGVVLRTQTSPVQMRVMERTQPPVAVVAPGRVYRCDFDASHSPMFYQLEGLLIDEGVSFADLKGSLMHFAHRFYGADREVRFRPHYFPFTEPSAEMDVECGACHGAGCRFCKHSGWVEILGCGMVHPELFRNAGYDYERYSGYAFGFGIDRIAVSRHGIDTLHHLYENDVRFLEQF